MTKKETLFGLEIQDVDYLHDYKDDYTVELFVKDLRTFIENERLQHISFTKFISEEYDFDALFSQAAAQNRHPVAMFIEWCMEQ